MDGPPIRRSRRLAEIAARKALVDAKPQVAAQQNIATVRMQEDRQHDQDRVGASCIRGFHASLISVVNSVAEADTLGNIKRGLLGTVERHLLAVVHERFGVAWDVFVVLLMCYIYCTRLIQYWMRR